MRSRLLALALAVAAAPAARAQASFQGLGDLPGGSAFSSAGGVSADGNVIVGSSGGANGTEAFRWTAAGGMVGLGDLPGGTFASVALGVSADGSVVVGQGSSAADGSFEAFRWTAAGGMVGLGDLPGGASNSSARDVSADGSVVVGSSNVGGNVAFRWTQTGGMVSLGTLGGQGSGASGVSDDGSVVAGDAADAQGVNVAFRWTQATGMTSIGDLPGGAVHSLVQDVSADGRVIVGTSSSTASGAGGLEAFRWTAAEGMVGLGELPGGNFIGQANGVSGDGAVVVGQSFTASGPEAFVWTADDGMRNLRDVLVTAGVDMTGWTLFVATDVSADGQIIVGLGLNPQGQQEAWRAVLSSGHHWTDPTGGSWDVAANWDPATVPGADDTAIFDLPGTYTVFGAGALRGGTIERLVAENGATVDFAEVGLAVTSPTQERPSLAVIGPSTAKLVSGEATMVFASVGAVAAGAGETARLQVFNEGTFLDGAASLLVGQAGRGEVFVANLGRLRTVSARLGLSAPGEVIAGNGGRFEVTDELELGRGTAGRLTVENGGAVTARLVTVGARLTADSSVVDVAGLRPGGGAPSSLVVSEGLVVGALGEANLLVRGGAEVRAGTVSLRGSAQANGHALVTGHAVSSSLLVAQSLQVGVASEGTGDAFALFRVEDGGAVRVEGTGLTLGGGAGHMGVLSVSGVHGPSGVRSLVTVENAAGLSGCSVGLGGSGIVLVRESAAMLCQEASLGFGAGSNGAVTVSSGGGPTSVFSVRGVTTVGDEGEGVVELIGGALDGLGFTFPGTPQADAPFDVEVTATGRIIGDGLVFGVVRNDGVVGPGVLGDIRLAAAVRGKEGEAARSDGAGTAGGTLLVRGRLVQTSTGVLEVALAGPDSTQQGRLRVRPFDGQPTLDGSAALGGTLRLAFQDGYFPRTGDTFTLLDAASTTGAFDATEVTGLLPGWPFTVAVENGAVVVTSLADGVPATPAEPDAPTRALALTVAPNPAAGTASLAFDVPAAGRVRLSVYDVLGREVAVVVDEARPAGAHAAALDTGRLAPGVYVVRLAAGGALAARALTVVR